ncbi:MAG TPA: beta-L-arabinofuranosidase domain-containing protein, partial [Bryobacteraceae bacterium]|nr:beta-L-arabinofuranosidase domain-containing protein [Bryobacteraceae bacterium]
ELYRATGDRKYLELAKAVVSQMETRPGLQIVSRSLAGRDVQEIGDGKIYQLLWNYVGLEKLFEVTGDSRYKRSVEYAWKNVLADHLTPGGGPWGGVAGHYEVFNPKGYFHPGGMVETCSTMSWIHLNRDLLRVTGDSRYADQIEKTLYNSLIGAQDPNGEDWSYFIFPNGRRSNTYYWACCKSSGALALEEIAPLVAGIRQGGVAVNLYTEAQARLRTRDAGTVTLGIQTDYPRSGQVRIRVQPEKPAAFPLFLRVPEWADGATIAVNGTRIPEPVLSGSYHRLDRPWKNGDEVSLDLPLKLKVESRAYSLDHHGQEIAHTDYMAVTRGPLVYATGLLDGYKKEETLKVPKATAELLFSPTATPAGFDGPAFQLTLPGRDPILFLPYYEAGGRSEGKWRTTWLQVAWQ